MDDAGMRIDELERSGADIAYVMPSHQFPMGNVMPVKRRMQLLSWADDAGERYIVRMIMTVNFGTAESRFRHCRV